ncbi:hypothetical protein SNEBB_010312 [Seison nebaliae]|nr:hypothetical protein SNEBB_010312 [Seison nebaliae]
MSKSAKSLPLATLDDLDLNKFEYINLFLDYDGTLTPIVDNPSDALLTSSMFDVLTKLSKLQGDHEKFKFSVFIISGRDYEDISEKVGIKEIVIGGCHGFDIRTYSTQSNQMEQLPSIGEKFRKDLEIVNQEIKDELDKFTIDSENLKSLIWVEFKRYSIAVHMRELNKMLGEMKNVKERYDKQIFNMLSNVLSRDRNHLTVNRGKEIFEIVPNVEWHKGKAAEWLTEFVHSDNHRSFGMNDVTKEFDEKKWSKTLTFFLGDDTTDETAFKDLKEIYQRIGLEEYFRSIVVCEMEGAAKKETFAKYRLNSTDKVESLLKSLAHLIECEKKD